MSEIAQVNGFLIIAGAFYCKWILAMWERGDGDLE